MICTSIFMQTQKDVAVFLATLQERFNPDQGEGGCVEETVRQILAEVKTKGIDSVVSYTQKFDAPHFTPQDFAVSQQALLGAAKALSKEDRTILDNAIANVRTFHEAQKERSWFTTQADGSMFGQMVLPVDRAGLYAPGGQGGNNPLISSVIMNAVPAQVAGVATLALVSPPRKDGTISPFILAVAHLLGITEVYAAGSAWGIAALAYGAGSLAPVDVIAGPGNIYVATAKRLLIGTVGIDMIAGPSEILVIADASANPAWVAADMLSQAEHDELASAVCITTSEQVAEATRQELQKQCAKLPRKDVATKSLQRYGAIIYTPDMQQGIALANTIAPEHLELLVENPWELLPAIRHAGAVFMGHHASESLGDYYAGPNHVLPTMGTARFSSALGVDTFTKKSSVISASPAFAGQSAEAVARMARIEGLEAHARSALCRKKLS